MPEPKATASFETLPPELMLLILEHLTDFRQLHSTITASPTALSLYQAKPLGFLQAVLQAAEANIITGPKPVAKACQAHFDSASGWPRDWTVVSGHGGVPHIKMPNQKMPNEDQTWTVRSSVSVLAQLCDLEHEVHQLSDWFREMHGHVCPFVKYVENVTGLHQEDVCEHTSFVKELWHLRGLASEVARNDEKEEGLVPPKTRMSTPTLPSRRRCYAGPDWFCGSGWAHKELTQWMILHVLQAYYDRIYRHRITIRLDSILYVICRRGAKLFGTSKTQSIITPLSAHMMARFRDPGPGRVSEPSNFNTALLNKLDEKRPDITPRQLDAETRYVDHMNTDGWSGRQDAQHTEDLERFRPFLGLRYGDRMPVKKMIQEWKPCEDPSHIACQKLRKAMPQGLR